MTASRLTKCAALLSLCVLLVLPPALLLPQLRASKQELQLLQSQYSQIERQLFVRNGELALLQYEAEELRCNPFYRPGDPLLAYPLCHVSGSTLPMQPYGLTDYRGTYRLMGTAGHTGIDWRADIGTPVAASHAGTVFSVESYSNDTYTGYGNNVKLRMDYGESKVVETVYAHLSLVVVEEGEEVRRGQLIGYTGNTGFSSTPHLHFGIRFLWKCDNGAVCGVLGKDNGYLGWLNPTSFL